MIVHSHHCLTYLISQLEFLSFLTHGIVSTSRNSGPQVHDATGQCFCEDQLSQCSTYLLASSISEWRAAEIYWWDNFQLSFEKDHSSLLSLSNTSQNYLFPNIFDNSTEFSSSLLNGNFTDFFFSFLCTELELNFVWTLCLYQITSLNLVKFHEVYVIIADR